MGANTKFGAKEVMDVILYDMSTNKPVIFFDTLKTSAIEVSAEKVYARGGKGNSKLITWELNKEAKLNIEDALLSPKSLELISGIATTVGKQTVYMRQATEYDTTGVSPVDKGELFPLTASSNGTIALAYKPKEAVANILVYEISDDCGTPLSMASAQLVDKTLTVPDAANKKVVVINRLHITVNSNLLKRITIYYQLQVLIIYEAIKRIIAVDKVIFLTID
jgi:hypothetical protein